MRDDGTVRKPHVSEAHDQEAIARAREIIRWSEDMTEAEVRRSFVYNQTLLRLALKDLGDTLLAEFERKWPVLLLLWLATVVAAILSPL